MTCLRSPCHQKASSVATFSLFLSPAYHRTLSSWARQYGDIFRLNVLGIEGLVVSSPKVIGQILGQGDGMLDLPKLEAYQQLDMVRQGCQNTISCIPQYVVSDAWPRMRSCGAAKELTQYLLQNIQIICGNLYARLWQWPSVQRASGAHFHSSCERECCFACK